MEELTAAEWFTIWTIIGRDMKRLETDLSDEWTAYDNRVKLRAKAYANWEAKRAQEGLE
jgi:hypothetical protein